MDKNMKFQIKKCSTDEVIAPVQSREEWLAIREAHHNVASRAYFRVWPQLDNAVIRRVFHIGHCKGYDATPQPINEPPQSDITELLARLEAAEADAARYRWLRNECGDAEIGVYIYARDPHRTTWAQDAALDAAIDAARAQEAT